MVIAEAFGILNDAIAELFGVNVVESLPGYVWSKFKVTCTHDSLGLMRLSSGSCRHGAFLWLLLLMMIMMMILIMLMLPCRARLLYWAPTREAVSRLNM